MGQESFCNTQETTRRKLLPRRLHPELIEKYSEVFKPLHPPNTLQDNLRPDQQLGPVDPTTVTKKGPRPLTEDEKRVRNAREEMPPVDAMLNLQDFEELAEKVLSKTAWAYYRSAGAFRIFGLSWLLS